MRANKNDLKDVKPQLRYLDPQLVTETCYAMMAGAKKYGEYNYLKGHSYVQLIEAAIRHLFAAMHGEELDADCTERLGSDVTHLGCAVANINMLLTQKKLGTLEMDNLSHEDLLKNLKEDEYENSIDIDCILCATKLDSGS